MIHRGGVVEQLAVVSWLSVQSRDCSRELVYILPASASITVFPDTLGVHRDASLRPRLQPLWPMSVTAEYFYQ